MRRGRQEQNFYIIHDSEIKDSGSAADSWVCSFAIMYHHIEVVHLLKM